MLIEDDAYGSFEPNPLPIATLIPERSYLAMTLSKCMAPGLRVAHVLTPDRTAASGLANALRTVSQHKNTTRRTTQKTIKNYALKIIDKKTRLKYARKTTRQNDNGKETDKKRKQQKR